MDAERVARGMTQSQLAEAVGVTYQQIHKYAKGINRLCVERFLDICLAIEVTPAAILREIHRGQPARDAGRAVLEQSRNFQKLSPHHRQTIAALTKTLAGETEADPR